MSYGGDGVYRRLAWHLGHNFPIHPLIHIQTHPPIAPPPQYPREYLVSTRYPNVITIRASGDYHAGRGQWKLSRQSLLAHSVGLLPFKDTFLTSTKDEPGGAIHSLEPNADLETLVATLTASIVGPGDGLHDLNMTRLMQSCRSDGLVLKPDQPAVAIDLMWTSADTSSEISVTHSTLTGSENNLTIFYLLAADVAQDYTLTPAHLGIEDASGTSFIAYEYFSRVAVPFGQSAPLRVRQGSGQTPTKFQYWTISPVIDGRAFIGERNKFVTASSKRFTQIENTDKGDMTATAACVQGEVLDVCCWKDNISCKQATCGNDGDVTFSF